MMDLVDSQRLPPQAGPRIVFASPHCLLDFTSGAANGTADVLRLLAGLGFRCQAFCGCRCDASEETSLDDLLARRNAPFQVRNAQIGGYAAQIVDTVLGQGGIAADLRVVIGPRNVL